jgi:hypothetical protein
VQTQAMDLEGNPFVLAALIKILESSVAQNHLGAHVE